MYQYLRNITDTIVLRDIIARYNVRNVHFLNDLIRYCFSDGYADPFGGPQGKKFMYIQLKDLLISIQSESMQTQRNILELKLEECKTSFDQVDDIVVIGIRF